MAGLPPGCLARFRPVRELARGGFGVVHLTTRIATGEDAVVKVLIGEDLSSDDQVARFRQEAQVARDLAHPRIVRVLDHDVTDGVPWIAYVYVPGGSLRDRMDAGRMPWRDAVACARDVAEALAHVHTAGVLHRDIKPGNVLVDEHGRALLTDFGIARCSENSAVRTATGLVFGSPPYLAPEVFEGLPASPASDLYALGILLYELVTGRPPFTGNGIAQICDAHRTARVPDVRALAPDAPPQLQAALERALAKPPTARFESATAMATELEHLLDLPAGRDALHVPSGRTARPESAHRATVVVASAASPAALTAVHVAPAPLRVPSRKTVAPTTIVDAPESPRSPWLSPLAFALTAAVFFVAGRSTGSPRHAGPSARPPVHEVALPPASGRPLGAEPTAGLSDGPVAVGEMECYALGLSLKNDGRPHEAVRVWERYLHLNPDWNQVRELLHEHYLDRARPDLVTRDLSQEHRQLRDAMVGGNEMLKRTYMTKPEYYATYAFRCLESGNRAEAIGICESNMDMYAKYGRPKDHLLETLIGSGPVSEKLTAHFKRQIVEAKPDRTAWAGIVGCIDNPEGEKRMRDILHSVPIDKTLPALHLMDVALDALGADPPFRAFLADGVLGTGVSLHVPAVRAYTDDHIDLAPHDPVNVHLCLWLAEHEDSVDAKRAWQSRAKFLGRRWAYGLKYLREVPFDPPRPLR